ncbi:hypothetical protein RI092_09360 [Lactococcus cremoris]|uniref:hypothetical protein n=4 Tax=Bacilli TaxID=91061 RepID=UPI0028721E5C|nr:hypothetical protein [Lactococcus cremoris]MDR9868014.1 hypothetical protein [Lactococcus cremoris]
MVDKLYARWEKSSNESEVISAKKALFLKSPEGRARIITTPKEKGTLFDIETGLKVRPITGRLYKNKGRRGPSYFAYYRGEDSPLKGVAHQIEWSGELQLFMKVFENIEKFQIEDGEQSKFYVIPEQMKAFERVETSFGHVILKFLVIIDYTTPYSQSYLYNQNIGLEFVFSSLPTPKKLVGLSEKGIPVFQAQAKLSEWAERDYGEVTDENFEEIKEELIDTFQNRKYRLQGKFVNSIQTTSENKEKYNTLKTYEEQIDELKSQINALEGQKAEKEKLLVNAKYRLQNAQKIIDTEQNKLNGYKKENEYYEKLESDNNQLTERLNEKTEKLQTANNELESSRFVLANLKDKLERIDNASWFERLVKKW